MPAIATFPDYQQDLQLLSAGKTDRCLSDMVEPYLAHLDASPKSVATYRRCLKQLFNWLSLNGIGAPTREDMIAYRDAMLENHKATTVQTYLTVCRLFFNWLGAKKVYDKIFEETVRGPRVDHEHKRDYLTEGQLETVLDKISRDSVQGKRDYAMLVLMATSGLRCIEVSRANIGDIRPHAGHTVIFVQGKGHMEKAQHVKVCADAERAVREYLAARGESNEDAPLFASESSNCKGNRLSTVTISCTVKKFFKAAGFNSSRLTAHSLRHTAVTLALKDGARLDEAQRFARHANIQTTMIYNHSLEDADNSCADRVGKLIFHH